VVYGREGKNAFAGATYDPSSHYRARRVVRFMAEQNMTIERLRELSLVQTERVLSASEGLSVVTPREPAARAGFVSVRVSNADRVVSELALRGVLVDARNDVLRIGPAPYVTNDEIDHALREIRAVLKA
jgi:kynureninase